MTNQIEKTAPFGDLVAAVFDQATLYSTDAREVSRLATQTIEHILRRTRRFPVAQPEGTSST